MAREDQKSLNTYAVQSERSRSVDRATSDLGAASANHADTAGRGGPTPSTTPEFGANGLSKDLAMLTSENEAYASLVNFAALSVINEGIHIVDASGTSIFYNSAMGSIEGVDPSKVLGYPLREVFPSLDPERSTLLRVLKTGKPIYDAVQTYTAPAGEQITTVNSTIPIVVDGKCAAAMEVARTLSRVRHLSRSVGEQEGRPARSVSVLRPNNTSYTFEDILGDSPSMLHAKAVAKSAAGNDLPIFIWGETGTGKELFAQSIHNESARASYRYVAVNCSALPESLAESTMFGTVRGAFTGAVDSQGLFEQANRGTLFLDEINSAGAALQSKLLRVVEERAVRRVGGSRLIPVDVRIIAASNVDPLSAMRSGHLRDDLYYRLSAMTLKIAPLRERKQDIVTLLDEMTCSIAATLGMHAPGYAKEVVDCFVEYAWPGNVREFRNVVQSILTLLSGKGVVTPEDIPQAIRENMERSREEAGAQAQLGSIDGTVAVTEVGLIERALSRSGGNVSLAAKELGITRQSLYYRMAKYGIKRR